MCNSDKCCKNKANNRFICPGPSLLANMKHFHIWYQQQTALIVRPCLLHILTDELNIFVRIWEIFSYQGDNLCQCGKSRLVDIIIKVSSSFSCSRAPAQSVCHNHNPEKTLSMIGYGSFPPSYFMFYNMEKYITPTDVFDQHKILSSIRHQEHSLVLQLHI